MSLSLYDASIGTFRHMLSALDAILSRAEAHAKAKGFDPANLLQARLAPDMFPLTRQVQIACDMAKAAAARLAGQTPPSHPDTETTFAELHERIAKVQTLLESADREAIESGAERTIRFTTGGREVEMPGAQYLIDWALPNFYFHVTTAYGLLRHNGVDLGKRDFLGAR